MTEEGKSILDEVVEWDNGMVTLRKAIEGIPGLDGWWKSDSGETFLEAAVMLGKKGLTPLEIICHLYEMHSAVAECFGG